MKRRLFIVLAVVVLCRIDLSNADSLDDQLNVAYKAARQNSESSARELQWTELHWINYRDAEANFQSGIVGEKHSGEARLASIAKTTKSRLSQLQRMVVSPDRPGDKDDETVPVYTNLRKEIIARKDPKMLAALIKDQQAWLEFADLDELSDPESIATQRIEQLKTDAALLKIDLTDAVPAELTNDRDTAISPDGVLRVEGSGNSGKEYFVISSLTGEMFLLPELKGVTSPAYYFAEFSISPDKEWILRTQKIYHGANGDYLYHRVSPDKLEFVFATKSPLSTLAWRYYSSATGNKNEVGVINFKFWKSDYLRLSLNSNAAQVNDWQVDFDLENKSFVVPKTSGT